jgi:chromosome segregation protein
VAELRAALARLDAEAKSLDARIKSAEAGRPQLVERLAKAEAAGRDSEVALAQALSAQAREQTRDRAGAQT